MTKHPQRFADHAGARDDGPARQLDMRNATIGQITGERPIVVMQANNRANPAVGQLLDQRQRRHVTAADAVAHEREQHCRLRRRTLLASPGRHHSPAPALAHATTVRRRVTNRSAASLPTRCAR